MSKNIFFYTKSIIIVLLFISSLKAEELTIIPLKKPILDKIIEQQKITQGIIRPKSKPIIKTEKQKLSQGVITPKSKPTKEIVKDKTEIVEKIEQIETKVVKKKETKSKFLTPKNKPILIKKTFTSKKIRSKHYSQKDFGIANKAIKAIEKRQWTTALALSKKAKDKSIYNFIQWRHLLTTGNQASFYDYLAFIKRNEDYPRINRIRFLAEHKLSTDKISPKKIIDWFNNNEPLSGFGKLILG